jgi:hypothetical protein
MHHHVFLLVIFYNDSQNSKPQLTYVNWFFRKDVRKDTNEQPGEEVLMAKS